MGKSKHAGKGDKHAKSAAQAQVRQLIKAGKLKKKCCKSKPRCKKCPVRALKKARAGELRTTA